MVDAAAPPVDVDAAAEEAPPTYNAYQLTLSGFVAPEALHLAFNAVGGLCMALLGLPLLGAVAALTGSLADCALQRRYRALMAESATTDPTTGLRGLAITTAL